jgi:hypothetical protein
VSVAPLAMMLAVLAGCTAPAESDQPSSRASPREPSSRSAPSSASTPRIAPPKVRFARAVAALRRSEALQYVFVLSDSGARIVDARGSWDPVADSASITVRLQNPFQAKRFAGRLIAVEDVWYGQVPNGCWIRLDRDRIATRFRLTEDTLGLNAGELLGKAQVTGVSPSSTELLEVSFERSRVLAMMGVSNTERIGGRVPGQVTVLNGRIAGLTLEGEDLVGSLGAVPPKLAKRASYLAFGMEFFHRRGEAIRKPRPSELAPDSGTPCRSAGPSRPA